jgi:hypothetical protein
MKASLRVLCSVSLTVTALVAGARAGRARAQRGIAPPRPAGSYPAAGDAIRIGESVEVGGQPMQLSLFSTPDPPARVARFYADAFRARSLVPILAVESNLAHVAAFDPADAVQRFVSAVTQRGGGTLVISGSISTRRPASLVSAAENASFPVPSGRRGFLAFRSVDASSTAESGQFVTALSPGEVAAFYRSSLHADRYSEVSGGAGEGMLTFTKGGSTISVAVQGLGEASGAAVFVTRSEVVAR